MNRSGFVILMAGLLLTACKQEEQAPAGASTNASSGNPLTAPADYLGAAGKAKQTAARTLDTVGLNQAIQLYFAQEGGYPKDLQELVNQKYILRLPDPPAGMKFAYNASTGELKVVPK